MKGYDFLLWVLAIVALFFIFSLSFNAVYWSDDFVFYLRLQDNSLFKYMWNGYQTWDGRFISLQAIAQALLIKYTHAPFAIFFWSLLFLLLAFLMQMILFMEFPHAGRKTNRYAFPSTVFVFLLLWFGFAFHISESVYRVVGGFYVMSLVMAAGWVWLFLNRPVTFSYIWLIGGFMAGILVGLMGVNGSFALLVFLLLETILEWRGHSLKSTRFTYTVFWGIALVAGTVFSILAPGNYIRGASMEGAFAFDIPVMLFASAEIFARYTYYSLPAIGTGLLLAVLFPLHQSLKNGVFIQVWKPRLYLLLFKERGFGGMVKELKWLLVGASSILPMLAIPHSAGRRTSVFFMLFMFLWIVSFFHKLFLLPGNQENLWFTINIKPKVVRYTMMLCFVIAIGVASQHFYWGAQIRTQIEEREAYFEQVRGSVDTVYVKPVIVKRVPFSYKFHDRLDSGYAKYHGFEKVILDTASVKELPYYYITPP